MAIITWSPRVGATGDDRYKWPAGTPFKAGTAAGTTTPSLKQARDTTGLNQIIALINWYREYSKAAGFGISEVSSSSLLTYQLFDDMQTKIDKIRSNEGQSAFSWTNASFGASDTLNQVDIQEFREALSFGQMTTDPLSTAFQKTVRKTDGPRTATPSEVYSAALDVTPYDFLIDRIGQAITSADGESYCAIYRLFINTRFAEILNITADKPTSITLEIDYTAGTKSFTIEVYESSTELDLSTDPITDFWDTDASGGHNTNLDTLVTTISASDLDTDDEIDLTVSNLDLTKDAYLIICGEDDVDKTEPSASTDNLFTQLKFFDSDALVFKFHW